MTATPETGTMYFRGTKTGQVYSVGVYISDVAAGAATFNPTGTAASTSLAYWRAPEDVVLVDYAQVTGTEDTTSITMTQDGALRNGTVLPYAVFLTTLNNRPKLAVPFPAGSLVGASQNA